MELSNIKTLTPEIVLASAGAVSLLVGLARNDSVRKFSQVIAALGLAVGFGVTVVGGNDLLSGISGNFGGYANYITMLVCAIGFFSVLTAWDLPSKHDPKVVDSQFRGEFFGLLMFSLAGVSMAAKVTDLIWLFVVLELVSIPTYIMVAMSRSRPVAQEAGVKYFFLGALAAAIYLFGFSYLYGYAGSTRYVDIAAQFTTDFGIDKNETVPMLGLLGLILVLVGVSYKIAAVPLHFYTPDVYQGAATPVTAFLAFAPKAAGMVAILGLLNISVNHGGITVDSVSEKFMSHQIVPILLTVIAVLTMTFGNVLALLQRNVKRLLAYSSIAHSGYMLVGLISGPGKDQTSDGFHATLFYLAAYAIMNLGAFAVLVYFQGKADAGEELDDLAGIAKEHPLAAFALAICFLSLIGMPMTVGFWGKFYLIQTALNTGHFTLAIIMVLNAAVAAAYYLRVIATMYLREAWAPVVVRTAWAPQVAAVACVIAVLAFGLFPSSLLGWSGQGLKSDKSSRTSITSSQVVTGTQLTSMGLKAR